MYHFVEVYQFVAIAVVTGNTRPSSYTNYFPQIFLKKTIPILLHYYLVNHTVCFFACLIEVLDNTSRVICVE